MQNSAARLRQEGAVSRSIPAWLVVALLAALALSVRLPHFRVNGAPGDTRLSSDWAWVSMQTGFALYASVDINHPPLFPVLNGLARAALEREPLSTWARILIINDVVRLKFFPVLAELILIVIAYAWLRGRGWLRTIIPLAMALHPGMIINSAVWGQSDPLIGLFLVLALLMFNRDKPGWAWFFYAVALLTKFQSIVLIPLMVIITYRRYPFWTAVRSAFIGALTLGVVMLPYILVSGLDKALHPYSVGSVGVFPLTTMFALNFWHVIEPGFWANELGGVGFPDSRVYYFAPLSDFQVGFLLLAGYTALICWMIWRQARQRREFLWGAALYFGFFMLPTQIHERYLYPAVVLTLFGLAQDRRLWVVALGTAWTFTIGLIYALNQPFVGLGSLLWFYFGIAKVRFALLNVLFLIEQTAITGFIKLARPLLLPTRLAALAVVISLAGVALNPPAPTVYHDEQPMIPFTVAETGVCSGYHLDWEPEGFWLTLYCHTSRPITAYLVGHVEAVRDGQVIGSVIGSHSDIYEGTWRWMRGQNHRLRYQVSHAGQPPPDSIYIRFYDALSNVPVLIYPEGWARPVYRQLIATPDVM